MKKFDVGQKAYYNVSGEVCRVVYTTYDSKKKRTLYTIEFSDKKKIVCYSNKLSPAGGAAVAIDEHDCTNDNEHNEDYLEDAKEQIHSLLDAIDLYVQEIEQMTTDIRTIIGE